MRPTIIHYDFCSLLYSSFYLHGFERLADQGAIELKISKSAPEFIEQLRDEKNWREILFSIAIFEFRSSGGNKIFCIDTRDSHSSEERNGKGFHLPLLEHVDLYFKANFNPTSVETEAQLAPYREKIFPISPFIPLSIPWHRYLPRVRNEPKFDWDSTCKIERLKHLKNTVSLDWIRRHRNSPKTCDVRLMVGFYHEPEQMHENQFRFAIMEALEKHKGLSCELGFASPTPIPPPFDKYYIGRALMVPHLRGMSKARTGIYVRGIHGCHSFKLGQLLALGIPAIGHRILNNQDWFSTLPDLDRQFAYEDPIEIAERTSELANNVADGERIGRSNAEFFDRRLSPAATIGPILEKLSSSTAFSDVEL